MRTSRIGLRDFVATILVAVAATAYGLAQSGVDLPGLGSTRAVAATVFVLGMLACGAGADTEAYYRPGATRAVMAGISVVGAVALVTGILAMTIGSETMLAVLVGATVVIWLATTLRHAFTPPDLTVDDVVPVHRSRETAGVR
jgi:hypothetical protein